MKKICRLIFRRIKKREVTIISYFLRDTCSSDFDEMIYEHHDLNMPLGTPKLIRR